MTKVDELYEQLEAVKKRKLTGMASAMQRHQEMEHLQRSIAYYEQGDSISRVFIQQEMAAIADMQRGIERMTAANNCQVPVHG